MILTQIPIFITARAHNEEIFKINKEALKFSYVFIKEQGLFGQTYIISDNPKMIEYAKELGFTKTILYECHSERDVFFLEYLATYNFGIENNYYPDWIIILNINQLFKTNELLFDCINKIDNKFDVIASYTEISDKSHFFLDKNNNIVNRSNITHILSSEAKREKMIDNAIYAVRSEFAFECMEYEDPSEHFWKYGRMKFFENKSLYTDIYTIRDISKFKHVCEVLQKRKVFGECVC